MNEIGQLAAPVDILASRHDALGQRPGAAAEHADLAHVAVLALHKLEERGHVWTTKVVHGLQAGEHGRVRQSLEVVLTNVLKNKITHQYCF